MAEALGTFQQARAGLRCQRAIVVLTELGFVIRDGRKQGHKVITHPGLDAFISAAFTCGHGRDPEIKPIYVLQLKKVVEAHADALRDYLARTR